VSAQPQTATTERVIFTTFSGERIVAHHGDTLLTSQVRGRGKALAVSEIDYTVAAVAELVA
jgi:hypothetical protein